MGLFLFVIFIIVPIIELYVIVQVAGLIGVPETIVLLIAEAFLGSWLVKRQGMAAWSRFRSRLGQGRVPTDEISDGMMIMFGGALLLTPGFVTDILGFILLFPPTRSVVKKAARKSLMRRVARRTGVSGVYEARVVGVERDATRSSRRPAPSPSGEHPAALEDDSPDKA